MFIDVIIPLLAFESCKYPTVTHEIEKVHRTPTVTYFPTGGTSEDFPNRIGRGAILAASVLLQTDSRHAHERLCAIARTIRMSADETCLTAVLTVRTSHRIRTRQRMIDGLLLHVMRYRWEITRIEVNLDEREKQNATNISSRPVPRVDHRVWRSPNGTVR